MDWIRDRLQSRRRGMESQVGYKFADIKIRSLPRFTQFSLDLSTLLDQDHPTGKDFRIFLEYLGFYSSEVGFLASRVQRPTAEALRQWEGSMGELVQAIRWCEREDAIGCVRRWIASHIQDPEHHNAVAYGNRVPGLGGSPSSYLPGIGSRYLGELADLPPIEELLEAKYYPSEVTRQISASFVIRGEDTSPIRRSSEYLCNQFTAALKGCFLIPKDATWMTNSTVYVNNLARIYFLVITLVNLVNCLCSSEHQPCYVLEFFIALIPVWESIYVDQHIASYRGIIKKIVQCQKQMDDLQKDLANCVEREEGPCHGKRTRHPSECDCECSRIYRELQDVKGKEEVYMHQAQPKYTDLRHCVFSALFSECVIIVVILLHALCCETFAGLHERLRDGFTSFAYILLLVDCFYNTVVMVFYYAYDTPRLVVEKDRFRHRHEIAVQALYCLSTATRDVVHRDEAYAHGMTNKRVDILKIN